MLWNILGICNIIIFTVIFITVFLSYMRLRDFCRSQQEEIKYLRDTVNYLKGKQDDKERDSDCET